MASMKPYQYDTAPSKGKEPATCNDFASSQPFSFPRKNTKTRPRISHHTFSRPEETTLAISRTTPNLAVGQGRERAAYHSSATWTSSSGDINLISKGEEIDDRENFIKEYNRLAKKYGIRPIIPGDFSGTTVNHSKSLPNRKGSWISRVLRHTSAEPPTQAPVPRTQQMRHRRSISDLALNLVQTQRKEGLKDQDLRSLVRLCGKSIFYLPAEYAPSSLVLPTCLRATAQQLVQHAGTRGIFRVPGSIRTVNALYDYYCTDQNNEEIATTTRCPNLPAHLNCGIHEVASTFKRLLAGLPGGILGSLALFDALVAIHSQIHGDPEFTKTKESKLRPRLIALAIGTVQSQYQRELICAVFGLLCLVGRAAENAPREDEAGRPLPTSDLMGYGALAILFGPLLVGDLINSYSMKVADPGSGLVLLPLTPPKSRKQRKSKACKQEKSTIMTVDRILVANDITKMLIVHWRDVVRHLRSLNVLRTKRGAPVSAQRIQRDDMRSSASDSFSIHIPPDWSTKRPLSRHKERNTSPLTVSPTPSPRIATSRARIGSESQHDSLSVQRRRPRPSSSASSNRLPRGQSMNALSPTAEEGPPDSIVEDPRETIPEISFTPVSYDLSKEDKLQTYSTEDAGQEQSTNHARQRSQLSWEASRVSKQRPCLHSTSRSSGKKDQSVEKVNNDPTIHPAESARRASSPIDIKGEYNRSGVRPESDPTGDTYEPFIERSTAGHTPLNHGRQSVSRRSTNAHRLGLSENDSTRPQDFTSQCRKSIDSGHIYLDENAMHLHNQTPLEPVLSESDFTSPASGVEKFPSFHHSVFEPARTPPGYGITRKQPATSQTTLLSDERPMTGNSSAWSLRQLIAKRSPRLEKESSGKGHEEYFDIGPSKTSPAARWKELVKNSPSSTPSVREKRMFRSSITGSARQSEESVFTGDKKAPTPEWKRQILNKKNEEKRKPSTLSPEKTSIFEKSPQPNTLKSNVSPTKGKPISPAKALTETGGRPPSQRSTSKPVGGAVKAMAALFDTASKDSPGGRKYTLTGRARTDLGNSDNFMSPSTKSETPRKSVKLTVGSTTVTPQRTFALKNAENTLQSSNGSKQTVQNSTNRFAQGLLQSSPKQPARDDTPTKPPKTALRPTGMGFSAARNEPRISPVPRRDRELTHAPSLGTMVPHREEPPVAQHLNFARPPSAASSRGHAAQQRSSDNMFQVEENSPTSMPTGSPRPGSGNSLLHAQIRTLQKQLELRSEEILQLRRQLETRSNMDVGTLSEKLRESNRECKMWRERAEAAEKRVAVFERFTSRIKALKEGPDKANKMDQQDAGPSNSSNREMRRRGTFDSSSSCTDHTEDPEVVKRRIHMHMQKGTRTGYDGVASFEAGDDGVPPNTTTPQKDLGQRHISGATAQLWIAAEDLLRVQRDM